MAKQKQEAAGGGKGNIANITDTSHGYLCPKCRGERRKNERKR